MPDSDHPRYDLPRFSVGVTAVSVLAVAAVVAPAPAPLGVVAVGAVALAVGLGRRSEAALALGAAALLGGVVLAGIDGRSVAWFLAVTVPVVFAWVSARDAVGLAAQVGRGSTTLRVELVHTVSTLAALVAGGGAGYLVSRTMTGGSSPLALALLLAAVVAFTVALRDSTD